jgi:hypothetical protein
VGVSLLFTLRKALAILGAMGTWRIAGPFPCRL